MAGWTSEEVLRFIDLYQNEPMIWDPKHEHHKKKNKLNEAWNRIADETNMSVNDLKRKKESLMATFRLHHKRVMQSKRSGMGENELYHPIWPFYEPMHNFLKDVYECSSMIDTEDNSASSSTHTEGRTGADIDANSPVAGTSSNPKANTSRVRLVKRRSRNPSKLVEASKEVSKDLGTLNRDVNENTATQDDECELYGRLLVSKLRRFSEREREEVMLEIDAMLINKRRNKQNTHTDTYSYTNRPTSSESSYQCEWLYSSTPQRPSPSADANA